MSTAQSRWAERNPELKKKYQDKSNLRRSAIVAGLDPDEGERIAAEHSGLCDICEQPPRAGYRLCFDHDHKTGLYRGMLCINCNHLLGKAGDNIEVLQKAIHYLIEARSV
jgi:hypothetical protein